jgi:hypothetical protein
MMNNFVNKIEIPIKLEKMLETQNKTTSTLEATTMAKCKFKNYSLEMNRPETPFQLSAYKIMDIICELSKIANLPSEIHKLNVYYDDTLKTMNIFTRESWESFPGIDRAIREIVGIIQEAFLDNYENYLIKNIETPGDQKRSQEFNELLIIYYKFIYCFDLEPFVTKQDDVCPLLEKRYMDEYLNIANSTKTQEIKDTKKLVREIIRKNSKSNIQLLNKTIVDMAAKDENFKKSLVYT